MIEIRAVDSHKVINFWRGVHHQMPLRIVKGDKPSMRIVVTALTGSLSGDIDLLISKGAELVQRSDREALMKDPEGNEFIVETGTDPANR